MNDVFRAFIHLYVFPSGRRLACARELARRAAMAEAPSVQALAVELANAETAVRELDHARKKAAVQAKHTAAAMALDRQVDACLSAMHQGATLVLNVMPASSAVHAAAKRFIESNFPQGLAEVVNQRYHEEAADAEAFLLRNAEPDAKADIALLGLGIYVEQLAQLQPLYAAELGAVPVGLPDYQAIVGGYRACQDKLVALVVEILAETRNAPSKAEALLAPIQFHQDAIGRYLRDRRKIRDVDPATGAEIDDSMPAT